jgi:N-acetylmuramoyl-L-alanine amidase
MRERIDDLDTTPLRGKRIVIDPGHGGRFDGAVGPTGLREADVNLGVALNLWGLLSDAGADATLTRSSDRTVADGEDTSLRDDLLARTIIANETAPHIFVSIHHNSDIGSAATVNRIETYYKASDPGPSLDAARSLHDHLSFNTGETRGGVLPGNYFVLRGCNAPSVLGEPSFISNPYVEARLKEADVQRMEAEAYFIGLLEYFSKGIPTLRRVAPPESVTTNAYPTISILPDPGREGIGIDPTSTEFLLDGVPVEMDFDQASGLISVTLGDPLPGGTHTVSVRVRNMMGNWSPSLRFVFDVETSPAHLILKPEIEIGAIEGVPFAVEARVYDIHMNPVADGTPVVFRSDVRVSPGLSLVKDGKAISYVVPPSGGSFWVEASCGSATMGFAVDASVALRARSPWWFFLRDASNGAPIAGATVSLDRRSPTRSNRDGFVRFSTVEGEEGLWRIEAPGYVWYTSATPVTQAAPFDSLSDWSVEALSLERAAGGLFHGRTIALDPEGGGNDRGGQGPSGTDASRINFEVAATLANLIENAGGSAILTRERGLPASDLQRLMVTEDSGAFRYIAISHRPSVDDTGSWIEHYPGSTAGGSLSKSLAWAARHVLDAPLPAIRESSRYALRMTSSPAVYVDLLPLDDRNAERFTSHSWNVSKEAYAIYTALLLHLRGGETPPGTLTVEVTLPDGSRPASGATVTLDGYLNLLADQDGTVGLVLLEDGDHDLEVSLRGYQTAFEKLRWPGDEPDMKLTITLEAE